MAMAIALLVHGGALVLGGHATARRLSQARLAHAAGVGVIVLLVVLALMLLSWGMQPEGLAHAEAPGLWLNVLLYALTVPAALLGGHLAARRPAPEPATV